MVYTELNFYRCCWYFNFMGEICHYTWKISQQFEEYLFVPTLVCSFTKSRKLQAIFMFGQRIGKVIIECSAKININHYTQLQLNSILMTSSKKTSWKKLKITQSLMPVFFSLKGNTTQNGFLLDVSSIIIFMPTITASMILAMWFS